MSKRITQTVRKRPQPSFYASSSVSAPAGLVFEPAEARSVTETISGIKYTFTWYAIPASLSADGKVWWVPEQDTKGVVYVVDETTTPPPSGELEVIKAVVYLKDKASGAITTQELVPPPPQ